jgi:hypothetical protein
MTMDLVEAADRLAIRELFDAYTHCADRRAAHVVENPRTSGMDPLHPSSLAG